MTDAFIHADVEADRYALRTFAVDRRKKELVSVSQSGSYWRTGYCVAECANLTRSLLRHDGRGAKALEHRAPDEHCACGIYGTLSLAGLLRQWGDSASQIVAVIAAEGKTIIGPLGLRTQAARVVAYWSPIHEIRKMAECQFVDATRFNNLEAMLRTYGLPRGEVSHPMRLARFATSTTSSVSWSLWSLFFFLWDTNNMIDYAEHQRYGWAIFQGVMSLTMAALFVLHYRRVRRRFVWLP